MDNAKQAIWQIKLHNSLATGFFIGTNLYITNLHVIYNILKEKKNTTNIVLSQGTGRILRVNRILAVSAVYDLALLEIQGHIPDYLSFRENALEPNEDLSVVGYPNSELTEIKKTEDIFYNSARPVLLFFC